MTTISPAAEQVPAAAPLVGRADVNRKRMARLGWIFTAPALIFIAAVTIFPIVYSVVMSLSNVTVTGNGISLNGFTTSNYSLVLKNATWHYALFFTIIYTFITVLIELALGTMIALVLERLAGGRGWMMALLLLPWSMITVINAELWGYIYQAAEVDGSSGWSTFWRITVPLLRPTLALALLFRVLQAFGLFDLPYVLTNGGPGTSTTSLAILGYNAIFKDLSFGPGAAVATTTALLVLLGCLLSLRTFRVQVGKEGE